MPRTCTICTHPHRREIDQALVTGRPYRSIAEHFGASAPAVLRHKEHVPAQLTQSHKAREVARADTLVARIESLIASAERILRRTEATGTFRGDALALAAIRELRETFQLLARMAGELAGDGTTVNILVNPQWVTIQVAILKALDPYPQAREAVSRALAGLDGDSRGEDRG